MNADAIMEGSVRREHGRIRVTVQLNNVEDGYHYWSRTWDNEGNDVFAIQQGIAQQVALSLRPSEAGVVIAGRPLTTDLDAYNLYLQGQFHRRRGSASSMKTAVGFYRQAIERDPSFAEAYVGLAILLNEAGTDGRLRASEAFPQSQAAVTKALELNPLLAAAYSAQGWISMHYDWNWDAAALREQEGWLVYLNVNPHFDGLRANPRFKDLVARIGLPVRDSVLARRVGLGERQWNHK